MNKLVRNALIGTFVTVAAVPLLILLDVPLAQAMQSFIISAYGGAAWVAELYLWLGTLMWCGVAAIVAILIAKGQRLKVAGLALAAIALAVLTWIGANYLIVAIYNAANLGAVNITDFFLVQAYGAAYLFPGGVVYYWMANAATYAIWFTILLVIAQPEPKLKYQLKPVAAAKPHPKKRKAPKYHLKKVKKPKRRKR